MYLFLTPLNEQDWRKGSQPARCTYNLQPDLLGGWGRKLGGPGGRFLTNKTYQLLDLNPELPFSQQHFPSKNISFLSHLLASKHFPEEQIFGGTDPLVAPVTCTTTAPLTPVSSRLLLASSGLHAYTLLPIFLLAIVQTDYKIQYVK